jgi:hypothetical protein
MERGTSRHLVGIGCVVNLTSVADCSVHGCSVTAGVLAEHHTFCRFLLSSVIVRYLASCEQVG